MALPTFRALFGLDGWVAVVAGAGQGIGAALAGLAGAGAHVALSDVDEAAARAQAEAIAAAGGRAFALHVDVANAGSVDRMVGAVVDRAGGIDVLVNNEGIIGPIGALETT
jgi:3-oxoacyl-[acyl-carrier protein] reductase